MAMLETAAPAAKPSSRVKASAPDSRTHYRKFELGQFSFERDEYFVTIGWSAKGARQQHRMSAEDLNPAANQQCQKDEIERVRQANAERKAEVHQSCPSGSGSASRPSVSHHRSSVPGRTQMTYAARTGP